MRIALIDHSFHQLTKSNGFFREILAGLGSVRYFYDDSWCQGKNLWRTAFNESDYDLIVVWQAHEAFEVLSGKHPNVVFVPMYDAMLNGTQFHWKPEFGKARTVSFSRALHHEVIKRNGQSRYFKYFPDPSRFTTVSDFEDIRPFFWYRTADISLDLVFDICKDAKAKSISLHNVPDPGQPPLLISKIPFGLSDIKLTTWFETSEHYQEALTRHNVFFAPRAVEGIGMSFIEAMASGLCVVAPNSSTMNEYIADGVNGLLYSFDRKFPLDFSRAEQIGARARETVERGFVDWQRAIPELTDFIAAPAKSAKPVKSRRSPRPAALVGPETTAGAKLSVVTVCLNAAGDLEPTIESVTGQNWTNTEYVVLDGGSSDGTVDIIRKHADKIAHWESTRDQGVYFAMNKAVAACTGDWVLFMNAGDAFTDGQSLSRMFRYVPPDVDVVFGHHLYIPPGSAPEYHPAADFSMTWDRLQRGDFGVDWGRVGLPCHQATAVRRVVLNELKFDTTFRLAADHELLVRAFKGSAKFFHCDELIASYAGGGISAKQFALCKQEWMRILIKHGHADAVTRIKQSLQAELEMTLIREITSKRAVVSDRFMLESQRIMQDLQRSRSMRLVSRVAPKLAGTIDQMEALLKSIKVTDVPYIKGEGAAE